MFFDPGDEQLVLAIAEAFPRSHFVLYLADIGKRNSFLKNQNDSSLIDNISLISQNGIYVLKNSDRLVDVAIYQPRKFIAHKLIESQLGICRLILKRGGRLYLLTHTRSGAKSHQKILEKVFEGDAEIIGRGGGGNRVVEIANNAVSRVQDGLCIRRLVDFDVLGLRVSLETEPSLFSTDDLDMGTRVLLENVDLSRFQRMLDIGCGWGAIGIVVALVNKAGRAVLADIDTRATSVASDNVRRLQLQKRVDVVATDSIRKIDGLFDLILSNPPFHADVEVLVSLFEAAYEKLRCNGELYIVVEQAYLHKFEKILMQSFGNARIHHKDVHNYFVLASEKKTLSR